MWYQNFFFYNVLDALQLIVVFLLALCGSRSSLLGSLLLEGDTSLVLAVLLDELDEILGSSGSRVGDGVLLVTSGEHLDGGEAGNVIRDIVGSSVNLGNDNLILELGSGVLGGKVIVLGGESLAVTAPGSVELEENILGVVENDIVVALGYDNSDGTLLLLRDGLRLDGRLNLALGELSDELGDGVLGDLLLGIEGELEVLLDILNGERGELVSGKVEVAGVSTKRAGVNNSEVDLALKGLSNRAKLLGELFTLVASLSENVGKRNASRHVVRVGVRADLADQWSGRGLDELLDGVSIKFLGESVLALVERLVNDDGGELDALSLSNGGIVDTTKEVIIAHGISHGGEGFVGSSVISGEVANDDNLLKGLEFFDGILGQEGNGRERLLHHVGDDTREEDKVSSDNHSYYPLEKDGVVQGHKMPKKS